MTAVTASSARRAGSWCGLRRRVAHTMSPLEPGQLTARSRTEPEGDPSSPDRFLRAMTDHTGDIRIANQSVKVPGAARKHGVADTDSLREAGEPLLVIEVFGGKPPEEIRIGFATAGRLLETAVLLLDDDRELIIHAMRARRMYVDEVMREDEN